MTEEVQPSQNFKDALARLCRQADELWNLAVDERQAAPRGQKRLLRRCVNVTEKALESLEALEREIHE